MNIYKVLIKIIKSQKTFVIACESESEAKEMALAEFAKFGEVCPITQVIVSQMA